MREFHVSILTPEGKAYEGEADGVTAPCWEGPLGVLAQHAPMAGALRPGRIRIQHGEETRTFDVEEGLVEIHGDRMVFLVPRVVSPAGVESKPH